MATKARRQKPAASVPESILERVPPHAPDSERALLGSLLQDAGQITETRLVARPEDFYLPAHVTVCEAVHAMHGNRLPVDFVTLCDYLRARGQLEGVGGEAALVELAGSVPSAANAPHYARIVRNLADRRRGIRACGDALRGLFDAECHQRVLTDAIRSLQQIAFDGADDRPQDMPGLLQRVLAEQDEAQRPGYRARIMLPWDGLLRIVPELERGGNYVIGGRSAIGKTTLALDIVRHVARSGHRALIFSLEMTAAELAGRLIAQECGIRLRGQRSISEADNEALTAGLERLQNMRIEIIDKPRIDMDEISARCEQAAARGPLGLIVVDYLQLVKPADGKANRTEQLDDISRAAKILAKETGGAVLMLAQLNRQMDQRGADKEPELSDLRGSGAIEQDADGVFFVHRPRFRSAMAAERAEAYLVVAKNRHGPVGKVSLRFEESRGSFVE